MWETGLRSAWEFEVDGYRVRVEAEGVELTEPLEIRLEPKETRELTLKAVR